MLEKHLLRHQFQREVHLARKAALYVARTQHAASRKPGGIVSKYLICATWALRWFELNRQRYDVSRFHPCAIRHACNMDAARASLVASRWFQWRRANAQRVGTADAMAKKYARLLSGEAYAAGWFDSWRDYLKKKQMAESMAKKYAFVFHGNVQLVAAAWFEHFRGVLLSRQTTVGADAAAQSRELWTDRLGHVTALHFCGLWFQHHRHVRLAERLQRHLGEMPSSAGSWSLLGTVWQHWRLSCHSVAKSRKDRQRRWSLLFGSSLTPRGEASSQLCLCGWFREMVKGRALRMLCKDRSQFFVTELLLRVWQLWTYEMAKGRAFRVLEEAILLRDDGLELCARVAQRREEIGPPWCMLALWWFWVGRCRTSRGAMYSLQAVALNSAEQSSHQLARCTEIQATVADRALLPLCFCSAWFAWVAMRKEARAVEGARRLEEAKKRPEMMVARASMFMGQLELSLYLQTSISAWIRYVAMSQMQRKQNDLEQSRSGYQIALQEHNAALDVATLKYEESLEKHTLELKEAEQRYVAATASRHAAGEALKTTVDLAAEQACVEAEEKYQSEAQRHEVAFEAQALRQRLLEDRLAAEVQAAEQTEALVMQRHHSALQALENKHQLALKGAEQKIQRALEKHRVELETRYKGEAEKRHEAAIAEIYMALERQQAEMASLERSEELLQQREQLAAARWSGEIDDLRHSSSLQQEILAQHWGGQVEAAARDAQLTTKQEFSEFLIQRDLMHHTLSEAEERQKARLLALELRGKESMEKMQKDLEQKHYQQSEQMALDHQSEIVKFEAALEAGQIKHQITVEKYTNMLEAVRQKHDNAAEILRREMEEKHITALADVDHQYSTTMAKCEAAKESAEVRLQLAEERFQQEMGKKDSMHQFALDNMKSDMEGRHAAALSSAQHQWALLEAAESRAQEKHQLSEEAAQRKEENAAQRLARQSAAAEAKYQVAIQRHEDEISDLKFQHDSMLRSRDSALEALTAKLKQAEARHAKAMEVAEEKFRKAFDRVKRVAIEEARQQILEHRRQCKACQQESLPLPALPPPLPSAPKAEPPKPQLTPQRLQEVTPLDLRYVESTLESLMAQRSKTWLWAQDLQRVVDQGIAGILELHQAMLLLLEQAARHSLLQGQEDPRAQSRISSVKQLVTRVTRVNDELGKLRGDRADFWFLLHQTAEEAVQYLRQANALPAPGPAVVKRLDHEIEELCSDQKRLAEAFSDLAMRLKTAGKSFDSLQEARGSLATNHSEEAYALDTAGADARDLLRTSGEVVSALLRDLRDLFYLVDGSNLRPRLRPHPSLGSGQMDDRPMLESSPSRAFGTELG
ncbi:unnamed protein product [Durusdinium trenchii]|uniref:Uncharacterized protein n=1 Tax=Durusdinium trenchii TaxID=1381693 RepID=A0ABP0NDJ8_9DINO